MMQSSQDLFTHCGLPGIDQIPFGMHACHFHRDREQLVAALAPYFLAGLEGNELCLWVTAPPLRADEAARALQEVWDGAADAIGSGALRILDFDQWPARSPPSNNLDVMQLWIEEEARALAKGHAGLRLAGNISFLQPDQWPTFMICEQELSVRLHGRRIVALCSYARGQCDELDMSEIVQAHHCLLEQGGAGWQVGPVAQGVRGAQVRAPSGARKAGPALYTFDCRSADDSPICLEAHELKSDGQALVHARKLLEEHPTCSTIEVFDGDRLVGAASRPALRDRPSAGGDPAPAP